MTAIGRLHHGGWLESIVLASTRHFFFPALRRPEIILNTKLGGWLIYSLEWPGSYSSPATKTILKTQAYKLVQAYSLKQKRDIQGKKWPDHGRDTINLVHLQLDVPHKKMITLYTVWWVTMMLIYSILTMENNYCLVQVQLSVSPQIAKIV